MSAPTAGDLRKLGVELVVVVVAFGLLMWAAEALARNAAERLLQRNVQQVTGVAQPPAVSLGDGFVLPQAIRGVYREVTVSAADLRSGPLRLERVDADLHDVRLSLRDLLLQDSRRFLVDSSAETARLTLDDLNGYFERTGRSVRIVQGAGGELAMRGEFDVLGQTVAVSSPVELSVDGSQLRLIPTKINTGGSDLSRFDRLLLQQRLDLSVPLDTLPFGDQLTGVTVDQDSLVLTATSTGSLVLRP